MLRRRCASSSVPGPNIVSSIAPLAVRLADCAAALLRRDARLEELARFVVATGGDVGVAQEARARGGRLILSGVRPGVYGTFARSGVIEDLGAEAIFRHEDEILASTRRAIAFAKSLAAQAQPRQPERSTLGGL